MNRIHPVNPEQATGKTKELLDAVQHAMGVKPNLTLVLANSPAALDAYLQFGSALKGGGLSARIREQIALAVAEANLCEYCLGAHTYIGGKLGLAEKEILQARQASSRDRKTDAILKFAQSVVLLRGEVTDTELQQAREAGLTDGEIVETVANVVVNLFTNYINHVAQTVVDFPAAKPLEVATAAAGCGDPDCGCKN